MGVKTVQDPFHVMGSVLEQKGAMNITTTRVPSQTKDVYMTDIVATTGSGNPLTAAVMPKLDIYVILALIWMAL